MCMECALRANVMGKEDGLGQKENVGVLFCHPELDKYEQLAQWLEQHPLLQNAGARIVFLPRVTCIADALRCACKCTCIVCYLGAVFGTLFIPQQVPRAQSMRVGWLVQTGRAAGWAGA